MGSGDEHDSVRFLDLMKGIRLTKTGVKKPRTRPKDIIADASYDTKEIRRYLKRRGIKANIPTNIRNRKVAKRGRPTRLKRKGYSIGRSGVERFFGWLKGGFRRVALRYERLASTFLALARIACIAIYLRVLDIHSL